MSKNLFITATEARSGKSAICLGIMELLLRNKDRMAFFRPLINPDRTGTQTDNDISLITSHFNLGTPYEKTYAFTTVEASNLIALGKDDELLEGVFRKYKALEHTHDFVLCEGTDYDGSTSVFEFDINAEIANNLGNPKLDNIIVMGMLSRYLPFTISTWETVIKESVPAKTIELNLSAFKIGREITEGKI